MNLKKGIICNSGWTFCLLASN